MTWHPIETAEKGVPILGRESDGTIVIAIQRQVWTTSTGWGVGWFTWYRETQGYRCFPTHWAPLPAGPEE